MQRSDLITSVHCTTWVLNGGETKKWWRMPHVRFCLKDRRRKI